MTYLSYETESRKVKIVPVNVLKLGTNLSNQNLHHIKPITSIYGVREVKNSLRISFINDIDASQFLNFFEIEESKLNWKYIKNDLFLYHIDTKYKFNGSFPSEVSFDLDSQISYIDIDYDYFHSNPLNETDRLILTSQLRQEKLQALGI